MLLMVLKGKSETQTDIAPIWMSAVATAPMVIDARMEMNMGLLWDGGLGQIKTPRDCSEGALGGMG